MSQSPDLHTTIDNILQNSSSRKIVYQNISSILKSDLENKETAKTRELFRDMRVLTVLETFYSTRFLELCNETFSFLYQICKIMNKRPIIEIKLYLLSLVPRLLVIYFYSQSTSAQKEKIEIDGLEILLNEIAKLEDVDSSNVILEGNDIFELFPSFSNYHMPQSNVSMSMSISTKKMKSNIKDNKDEPESKPTVLKVIEVFLCYLHEYDKEIHDEFLDFVDMISGSRVNLRDLRLTQSYEFVKNYSMTLEPQAQSKVFMKLISGLETLRALKPKYGSKISTSISHLSLRAVNSGIFLAYTFGETSHSSELEDVF